MKYYGFYRGIVVQCLNNGFCRIRIPDILEQDEKDINTLPIAECAQTLGGGGNTNNGTFTYPVVGSIVWCFFEGGNLERPVYFAMSNAKSEMWNNVMIPTTKNTNKGNDGISVQPSGHLTRFSRSSIHQQFVLDKAKSVPIGDKIDIKVETTAEQENMYNKSLESSPSPTGFSAPFAAHIQLNNKRNTCVITAKNSIILRAPNIILDSTGFERPGYVLIKSNETDNLTDNGPFRVMTSKVNIDGGENAVVIQSLNDIKLLKGETSGVSEKSQQDYNDKDE